MQERLSSIGARLKPVRIPSGKSETELWRIFDQVTDCFKDEDEVCFDITNAFRYLPILSLLIAAFLRVAKKVKITHILYGAYEARNEETHEAPVFDLTAFLELLDWTTATEHFLRTGDARGLASFAQETQSHLWKTRDHSSQDQLPTRLSGFAKTMNSIALSLETIRIDEFFKNAGSLHESIQNTIPEAGLWLKPLSLLFKKIEDTYLPFQADEPTLELERKLIHWYYQHGHLAQAIALSREWLVSWVCEATNLHLLNDRSIAEDALNSSAGKNKPPVSNLLKPIKKIDQALGTWEILRDLRNDVMHCSKKPAAKSIKVIEDHYKICIEAIDLLTSSGEVPPMILINFSHPLTSGQLGQISSISGSTIERVLNIKTQFDYDRSFVEQVEEMVGSVGLNSNEWQTLPLLINPPGLNSIALVLLAHLHGLMGYFPAILCLNPVSGVVPPKLEVVEIINLQDLDDSRLSVSFSLSMEDAEIINL